MTTEAPYIETAKAVDACEKAIRDHIVTARLVARYTKVSDFMNWSSRLRELVGDLEWSLAAHRQRLQDATAALVAETAR